jgi:hypothetical protein
VSHFDIIYNITNPYKGFLQFFVLPGEAAHRRPYL